MQELDPGGRSHTYNTFVYLSLDSMLGEYLYSASLPEREGSDDVVPESRKNVQKMT